MIIANQIVPISDLIETVQNHAHVVFAQTASQQLYLDKAIRSGLDEFIEALREDLYVNVESPYVDKIYRDSYYQYYASKLGSFSKDCVRLSFFDAPIEESHFRVREHRAFLQEHYLGFLVVRPTSLSTIGRNVLSPRAMRLNDTYVCQTTFSTTVNGVKLMVSGFPHSSQDVETITCAQTSLWATMEYFSHRYADYQPVLPSIILKRLDMLSVERQMPASGLSVEKISFALKEFGFGTRIYDREKYSDFEGLLSCYVESGIPIVVAIQNQKGTIGHAMVCIGHETIHSNILAEHVHFQDIPAAKGSVRFFDQDRLPKEFVFIDDNLPPYTRAPLSQPAINYPPEADPEWQNCTVVAFVAPLHRKVYLEAYEAKKYVRSLLKTDMLLLPDQSEVILRFFLTSSRSYKDWVSVDARMNEQLKEAIMTASMPKFIWLGELSNQDLINQHLVYGIVVLDATEADTSNHNALIIAASTDKIVNFAAPNEQQRVALVSLEPFSKYDNNLTSTNGEPTLIIH